ncbi:unnamed protein product [Mesocestoides corti]|uniref:SSD domain-containing protein n=2 Tax=Mesocestoides corti TaxID=53468 RepID=A0A158QSD4_MESCO|nr:unnamed protein product [Mesocestoides corti]
MVSVCNSSTGIKSSRLSAELNYLADSLRSGDAYQQFPPLMGSLYPQIPSWGDPYLRPSKLSNSHSSLLGGLPGSEFMGSMESVLQVSSSHNILTPEAFRDHMDLLVKIHRLEVKVGSSVWRLEDLCQRAELPRTVGLHKFESLLARLIPCVVITPADCFWEGSKVLVPDGMVQIPWLSKQYTLRWPTLNPQQLLTNFQAECGNHSSDLTYLDEVTDLLSRAGMSHGYLTRPCLDPHDLECPSLAPNHKGQPPNVAHVVANGCPSFAANILHWPRDLILGGQKYSVRNQSTVSCHGDSTCPLVQASALQSLLLLRSPQDLYRTVLYNDPYKHESWNLRDAQNVLDQWRNGLKHLLLVHNKAISASQGWLYYGFTDNSIRDMLTQSTVRVWFAQLAGAAVLMRQKPCRASFARTILAIAFETVGAIVNFRRQDMKGMASFVFLTPPSCYYPSRQKQTTNKANEAAWSSAGAHCMLFSHPIVPDLPHESTHASPGASLLYGMVCLLCWREPSRSQCWLALAGLGLIVLALVAGLGICSLIGIPFNVLSVQILLCVVLPHVRTDNCVRRPPARLPAPSTSTRVPLADAMGPLALVCGLQWTTHVLAEHGTSLVFSALSIASAFFAATYFPVPVMRQFCLQVNSPSPPLAPGQAVAPTWLWAACFSSTYAGILVVVQAITLLILFPVLLKLDSKRRIRHRMDVLCCLRQPVSMAHTPSPPFLVSASSADESAMRVVEVASTKVRLSSNAVATVKVSVSTQKPPSSFRAAQSGDVNVNSFACALTLSSLLTVFRSRFPLCSSRDVHNMNVETPTVFPKLRPAPNVNDSTSIVCLSVGAIGCPTLSTTAIASETTQKNYAHRENFAFANQLVWDEAVAAGHAHASTGPVSHTPPAALAPVDLRVLATEHSLLFKCSHSCVYVVPPSSLPSHSLTAPISLQPGVIPLDCLCCSCQYRRLHHSGPILVRFANKLARALSRFFCLRLAVFVLGVAPFISAAVLSPMHLKLGLSILSLTPTDAIEHGFVDKSSKLFGLIHFQLVTRGNDAMPLDEISAEDFGHAKSTLPQESALLGPGVDFARSQARLRKLFFDVASIPGVSFTGERIWLDSMRDWLLGLQKAFDEDFQNQYITDKGNWSRKASENGVLGLLLIVQTDNGIDLDRIRTARLVRNHTIDPSAFRVYLHAWRVLDAFNYTAPPCTIIPDPGVQLSRITLPRRPGGPADLYSISPARPIQMVQTSFFATGYGDIADQINFVKKVRALTEQATSQGVPVFPTGLPFTLAEQYLDFWQYFCTASGILLGVILVAGFVFLPNPVATLLAVCVGGGGAVSACLLGFLILGLDLNAISGGLLLTSFGLGSKLASGILCGWYGPQHNIHRVRRVQGKIPGAAEEEEEGQQTMEEADPPLRVKKLFAVLRNQTSQIVHVNVSFVLAVALLAAVRVDFIADHFFRLTGMISFACLFNCLVLLPTVCYSLDPVFPSPLHTLLPSPSVHTHTNLETSVGSLSPPLPPSGLPRDDPADFNSFLSSRETEEEEEGEEEEDADLAMRQLCDSLRRSGTPPPASTVIDLFASALRGASRHASLSTISEEPSNSSSTISLHYPAPVITPPYPSAVRMKEFLPLLNAAMVAAQRHQQSRRGGEAPEPPPPPYSSVLERPPAASR